MIHSGDAVVRAFAAVGWGWGGSWTGAKDFMHFSSTGR
jgi:D-alanyl-D-alanine carboxypeptidase